MKKPIIVGITIIFVITAMSIYFCSLSFPAVIHRTVPNVDNYEMLLQDVDSNGDVFRIVRIDTVDGEVALAYLTRKSMIFWTVTQLKTEKEQQKGFVGIGWIMSAGIKAFEAQDEIVFEREWHIIYVGNNAIKLIDIPQEKIPSNVTINVQQARAYYQIHVISFADPDPSNKVDVRDILLSEKLIKD